MMEDLKKCSKCLIVKETSCFRKAPRYKDGIMSECKDCTNARSREYMALYTKRDGGVKHRNKSRLYRENNFEKARWAVKRAVYKKVGLIVNKEEYDELLKKQMYKCAICDTFGTKTKALCLDHCHINLKIRGFLCDNCNIGLGKFKDNIELLTKASEYLKNNV